MITGRHHALPRYVGGGRGATFLYVAILIKSDIVSPLW